MAVRQLVTPNLDVPAIRGYCLKYVDDAVNAPLRQPTAAASYKIEHDNGNIRTGDLPVGVWVPVFFALNSGAYAGLGHVAWAFNHGDWVEVRDSETRTGARAIYRSIAEVTAWFGKSGCSFLGWSYRVDGVHIVEDFTPEPVAPTGKTVSLPASATSWRVYPLDKAPVVGNEVGRLNPSLFGGLTYDILGEPQANVVTIQTRDFGKVNIYVGADTGATRN